jgi:membrane protein DedA with SNARE-associated domain
MMGAALAGTQQFNIWLVFLATASGAVLGGMLGYWVGMKGGRALLLRYGRYVLITPPRFNQAEQLFQKHGNKAVLFGRYLPVLCFMAGVLSGIARLSYRRFFAYNLAGALLWCATHLTLGFVSGRSLHLLIKTMNNTITVVAVVAVAGIVIFAIGRKLRTRRPRLSQPIQISLEEPLER